MMLQSDGTPSCSSPCNDANEFTSTKKKTSSLTKLRASRGGAPRITLGGGVDSPLALDQPLEARPSPSGPSPYVTEKTGLSLYGDSSLSTPSARVLLVDDNQDSLDMLRVLLQIWGYAVEVAADGLSGLH